MGVKWAEERTATLLRVEQGESWLQESLTWTLAQSIKSGSFLIPTQGRFTDALALGITGHQQESRRVCALVSDLASGSLKHLKDDGGAMHSLNRKAIGLIWYSSLWLLSGQRVPQILSEALHEFQEAEKRATAAGLELGEDGYEEMSLLSVLLGDGDAALQQLQKVSGVPFGFDASSVMQGAPTRARTLALAAHYLVNPAAIPSDSARARLEQGIANIMKEEFCKRSPDSSVIPLWLDLPNVVFGLQGDPWAMLVQLNQTV